MLYVGSTVAIQPSIKLGIPESPWISKFPQVVRTSSGVTESFWTTLLGNARLNHLADQVNYDLEYLFWRPKIHKLRNEAKIIHLNTTNTVCYSDSCNRSVMLEAGWALRLEDYKFLRDVIAQIFEIKFLSRLLKVCTVLGIYKTNSMVVLA